MSNINQFIAGLRPPKTIVNGFSTSGFTPMLSTAFGAQQGAKRVLSGSLTANTLKTVLSLSGQGIVNYLSFFSLFNITRTMRCKVTIDGNVVFDSTSAPFSSYDGGFVIGAASPVPSGAAAISLEQIPYYNSFVVEVASSLTETDNMAVDVIYKVN